MMLKKVNMSTYLECIERYELRNGMQDDAPDCPYGNKYQWIGAEGDGRI